MSGLIYFAQTAGISFVLAVLLAPVIIRKLRELKFGQKILEDGPTWHNSKAGTPTMGGLMFMAAAAVCVVVFGFAGMKTGDFSALYVLLLALCFGLVGFLDDFFKVKYKRNLGLTSLQKALLQMAVSALYLYITIILSFIGWTGLARVVRGKVISLRKEDYVTAARLAGVSDFKIITKHLVPGFLSYLIVNLTLGIPGSILGETSMSYLGLGMKAPATSWGVLLKETEDLISVAQYPWRMIPLIFVVITVLAFNFLGDGLRDAADPYK